MREKKNFRQWAKKNIQFWWSICRQTAKLLNAIQFSVPNSGANRLLIKWNVNDNDCDDVGIKWEYYRNYVPFLIRIQLNEMWFWTNSIDFRIQFTSKFWLGHIVGRNKNTIFSTYSVNFSHFKTWIVCVRSGNWANYSSIIQQSNEKKITRIILFHVLNSVHHALNTHTFVLKKHFVFVNKKNFSHCFRCFGDFNNFMRMQEWYLLRNVGYEKRNSTQGKSLLCDVSCLKER